MEENDVRTNTGSESLCTESAAARLPTTTANEAPAAIRDDNVATPKRIEMEGKACSEVESCHVDFGKIYHRRFWTVLACSGVAGVCATLAIWRRAGRAAAAGVVSAFTFIAFRQHTAPRRKLRHIPGPAPDFFGGNLRETYEALSGIADCTVRWHQEHGHVVRVQIGSKVMVMCAEPALIERHFRGMEPLLNRPSPPLKAPYPHLLFSRDDQWKRMRRTMAPIFSEKNLRLFAAPMQKALDVLLEVLHATPRGQSVDISRRLGLLTMDVIGSSAFGTRLNCQKATSSLADAAQSIFAGALTRANVPVFVLQVFPWLRPFVMATILTRRLFMTGPSAHHAVLDRAVEKMVKERRANPVDDKDLLELLLQARDSDSGLWLSDAEVHGNSRVMLLAGYETTSNALGYIVFAIAQNKEVERKLLAEIDRLSGLSSSGGCDDERTSLKDSLSKYEYVSWVCNEALRLFPPVHNWPRDTSRDLEFGGHHVPAGTAIVVSAIAIHRDSRFYPDPMNFKPERWDPAGQEQQQRPECAFVPFGFGARKCIGYRFAIQEMQMAVVRIYSEFTFRLNPSMQLPLQLEPSITMSPLEGISVIPERRN
eukprot:TRINITY_DN4282_c0_g1_i1.p1 TRINITY_DN4282_c0_g1~~TRINITY_DN4282_c0_g1_i1.p1  ORF type:complete len:617 (+),score=91.38 TRINITY_DN4282_c0_g1_i1:69-1853(+)